MNFKLNSALAAVAFACVASPAFAQDRDKYEGPYIAVSGGFSSHNNSTSDTVLFDTNRDGNFDNTVVTSTGANAFSPGFCPGSTTQPSNVTTACTRDHQAVDYSVRLGYDYDLGGVVAGLLVEGAKNNSTDSVTAFSTTPASYSFTRGIDYSISARARLGISPRKGGLMYVTGGGSYAKIDHQFNTTNTANSFTAVNPDKMVWGYQVGGGAEILLGRNLTLGMEYLYNRYNDDKYYVSIGNGTAGATNPFVLAGGVYARPSDTHYDFHSFRAVVGLRF